MKLFVLIAHQPSRNHVFNSNFILFILQGSDGGSVVFASTPAQAATTAPSPTVPRKTDFPTTGLPLSNGPIGLAGSASPIPVSISSQSTTTPAPSPAPAALPPPNLPTSYSTPMQVSNRFAIHLVSIKKITNEIRKQKKKAND